MAEYTLNVALGCGALTIVKIVLATTNPWLTFGVAAAALVTGVGVGVGVHVGVSVACEAVGQKTKLAS
mgnify:CR=1 FL=1